MGDTPKIQPSQSKAADAACGWLSGSLEKACRVEVAKKEAQPKDTFVFVPTSDKQPATSNSQNKEAASKSPQQSGPGEGQSYKDNHAPRRLPLPEWMARFFETPAERLARITRLLRESMERFRLPQIPEGFVFLPPPPPPEECGNNVCAGEETDQSCPADCSPEQPAPVCGDGHVDANEQCDSTPNCDPVTCQTIPEPPAPFCGDGQVNSPNEQCDGEENCDENCNIIPEQPDPFCGDGNVDEGEQCDGGENCDPDTCQTLPEPPPPRPGICDQVGPVSLADATVAVPGRNTDSVGLETTINGQPVRLIGSPYEERVYVSNGQMAGAGPVQLGAQSSGVITFNGRAFFGKSLYSEQDQNGNVSRIVIGDGGLNANGVGDSSRSGGFFLIDAAHQVFQPQVQGQQNLGLDYNSVQPGNVPPGVSVLLGRPSEAIGAQAVVKGGEIFVRAGNASDCTVLPLNFVQGVKTTEQVRIDAQRNGINTPRFVHDPHDPLYTGACDEIGILDVSNDERYYVMKHAGARSGVRMVLKTPNLPNAVVFPQPENTWFFTILPNGETAELGSRIVTAKLHGPNGPESLLLTAPGEEIDHPQEGLLNNAGTVYLIPGPGLQNALPNIQNGEGVGIDDLVARTGGRKFKGDQLNGRLGDNGVALIPAGTNANGEPVFHLMIGAQFFSGNEGLNDSGCTFAMCNQTLNGMPREGFIRQIAPTWIEGNANEQYLGAGMFFGPINLGVRDEHGNFYLYPITSQQQ